MTLDCIRSNGKNILGKLNQTILFVDDEEDILKALKRSLRSEPYEQYYVQSAEEALELMAHHSIHVLVSDMRMTPMSGTELLEKVASRYPEIIRMVISGWADVDSILDAENICNLENEKEKIQCGVDDGLKLLVYGRRNTGKTSLIKALTGIDADRLKEEKERGITIELGFAHLRLCHKSSVQIVHLGDFLRTIFQRQDLVSYVQTVAVMKVYFVLAKANLMMRCFDVNCKVLQRRYYLFYDLVSLV